jgi:hypothetical protein
MAAVGRPRIPQASGARKRPDPSPGNLNGAMPLFVLTNEDPNRRYVWVGRADRNSIAMYRSMGYKAEVYREGGVSPLGVDNGTPGTEIESADNLLMSVPAARHEEIERHGPFGGSGQERADVVEKAIIAKRNGYDPLRGLHGLSRSSDGSPYVMAEKDIGPMVELE